MKHNNISIFIPHQGCPNCCSFCNQRTISSTSSPPSAQEVTSLLESAVPALKNPQNTEIAFFGGSFTAIDRDYMISLLEAAKPFAEKLAGIRISTRPDCIDEDILCILKKYGVTSIELGAQSMKDHVLSANDRGHSAEQVRKASALIKEHGFSLGLQMMTGLYESEAEDDICTAEEIISLRPDTVRIYPVVILGGTKLADLYQSGVYKTVSLEEMTELCAELLMRFEKENIRVIRLGLHASENVEGEAVGGYYHPAFRELCLGVIFRNKIESLLPCCGSFDVYVNPRALSMASGQKKCNMSYFKEKGINIKIKADSCLGEKEIRFEESIQN